MILHVANVVAPVLLCVLLGFGLAKFNAFFDHKMVSSLVSNIGYPALILAHLSAQHVPLSGFFQMLLAAVAMVACFAVIGLVFLQITGLPKRAFLSPLMLNNVGNVGLPVAGLAFGAEGMAYAIAFVVVVLVGIFTIGMWLPMGKVTWRDLYRSPVIYSVIVAIALMASDTKLPSPIDHTFSILGGLAIPLMLLTLGHTLATLETGALWRGLYLTAFHLAMAVGVALVLVHLFGLTGTARGIVILQCIMPVSVSVYLWIEMYDPEHAPDVASFILISTLATVVVLPVVLTYWI
ncbi:MAG: AEC family transporter [Alphaproteobacteria bacterium]|nr:AEC family transporter [Alphaproteobacteria bacterium]